MVAGTMASTPNAQTRTKFSLEQQSKVQDLGMEGTKRRDSAVNGEQQQVPKMSSSSSIKKLDCNRLRLRVEEEPKDSQSPPKQQECCMCGDVGFSTELFRCGRCHYRHQHTYCSRFYPSICDFDVCDWCSQGESNLSGNSKQPQSSSRGATKSSSKRKLLEAPAAAAPPNAKRSSSNCSSQYTDALELLLEVAQTVADGPPVAQTVADGKQTVHEEQQQQLKKQQDKVQQRQQLKEQQQVEVFSSPKGKVGGNKVLDLQNITKRQSCEGDGGRSSRLGQFPKSSSNKLHQLSTSRSMGRRYKLLSDVLC